MNKIPYALLDLNRSRESSEFIAKIDGSRAFERAKTLFNANEITKCIDSGEVIFVVSIPPNASSYIGTIAGNFNAARNPKLNSINVETISWYNPNLITRWNFLPTLMIMLSLVQVLMLSGLSVAREH